MEGKIMFTVLKIAALAVFLIGFTSGLYSTDYQIVKRDLVKSLNDYPQPTGAVTAFTEGLLSLSFAIGLFGVYLGCRCYFLPLFVKDALSYVLGFIPIIYALLLLAKMFLLNKYVWLRHIP